MEELLNNLKPELPTYFLGMASSLGMMIGGKLFRMLVRKITAPPPDFSELATKIVYRIEQTAVQSLATDGKWLTFAGEPPIHITRYGEVKLGFNNVEDMLTNRERNRIIKLTLAAMERFDKYREGVRRAAVGEQLRRM